VIPDEREALALHRKYGSNDHIVDHCRAVASVTEALLSGLEERGLRVERKAAVAAALLHDIGRNRTQTVEHGFVGAQILENEGVDENVVEMVRRHVGAGISKEEAEELGFPPGDYIPRTLEQKVVCFADKMVSGALVTPFEKEVERFIRKGHDVERLRRLKEDLRESLGRDPEELVLKRP
jgi:uncharacterized protein (TIGR00295 family)